MTVSSLRWPLLALLGLLVAAAIAFLATRAVSTDIGISSEPPTAGRALSPAPPKPAPAKHHPTTSTTTATATVTVPAPSSGGGTVPAPSSGGGETGDD